MNMYYDYIKPYELPVINYKNDIFIRFNLIFLWSDKGVLTFVFMENALYDMGVHVLNVLHTWFLHSQT